MATPAPSSFNEFRETILCDEQGQPILVNSSDKVTLFGPNNEMSEHTHDTGIRLVDGLIWFPYMMRWTHPILLTTCSICRNPPVSIFRPEKATHGLLSVRNARVCVSCGSVSCSRHRQLLDKGWYCIHCAGKARITRFITSLFFREES